MSVYVMYCTGECEDALRDRDFYAIRADSERQAHEKLYTHLVAGYDQDIPYALENVVEDYSVFLHVPDADKVLFSPDYEQQIKGERGDVFYGFRYAYIA